MCIIIGEPENGDPWGDSVLNAGTWENHMIRDAVLWAFRRQQRESQTEFRNKDTQVRAQYCRESLEKAPRKETV